MRAPKRHDVSGQVFGRLTATADSESRARRRIYWRCLCECGNEKWVLVDALKAGCTRSCGCLNDEVRRITKHGGTVGGVHTPEYASWHSMIQRCTNPNNRRWNRYGGRGITVCQRWLDSFAAFFEDMGPRPVDMSLERKHNDRGYNPENCEWALRSKQARNTSRNRFFTHDGVTLCLDDWVARTGIAHATLHHRLSIWPVEKALTEPVRGRKATDDSL